MHGLFDSAKRILPLASRPNAAPLESCVSGPFG